MKRLALTRSRTGLVEAEPESGLCTCRYILGALCGLLLIIVTAPRLPAISPSTGPQAVESEAEQEETPKTQEQEKPKAEAQEQEEPEAQQAEKEQAETAEAEPQAEQAPEGKEESDEELSERLAEREDRFPIRFRGSISARWRGRFTDSEHDNDLYTYVRIRGNDPAKDDFSFSLYARATQDLDGTLGPSDDPTFFSITDTFDHAFNARLYRASFDFQGGLLPDVLPIRRVRLGRQSADLGYTYLFDGISVTSDPIEDLLDLEFSFFGGVPVRFFESSPAGDWIAGGQAKARLTRYTTAQVEYTHVQERFSGFDALDGSVSCNYVRIGLDHQVSECIQVRGRYGILDSSTRDFEISTTIQIPKLDSDITGHFTYLAKAQSEHAFEYDPYFGAMGAYQPYLQVGARAQTVLGSGIVIAEGFDIRQLLEEEDEGEYNREFGRIFASLTLSDWLADRTEVTLSFDLWDTEGQDSQPSAGLEFLWRPSDEFDTAVGTYYALYRLSFFGEREKEDVQTWYLRGRYRLTSELRLDGRYEFEDADGDYYHAVYLGMSYVF